MSSIAHYSSSLYPIFFFFKFTTLRYSSVTNFPNPEGSLLSVWEGIGAVLSSKSREPNVIHARVNTDNACSYKSKKSCAHILWFSCHCCLYVWGEKKTKQKNLGGT